MSSKTLIGPGKTIPQSKKVKLSKHEKEKQEKQPLDKESYLAVFYPTLEEIFQLTREKHIPKGKLINGFRVKECVTKVIFCRGKTKFILSQLDPEIIGLSSEQENAEYIFDLLDGIISGLRGQPSKKKKTSSIRRGQTFVITTVFKKDIVPIDLFEHCCEKLANIPDKNLFSFNIIPVRKNPNFLILEFIDKKGLVGRMNWKKGEPIRWYKSNGHGAEYEDIKVMENAVEEVFKANVALCA